MSGTKNKRWERRPDPPGDETPISQLDSTEDPGYAADISNSNSESSHVSGSSNDTLFPTQNTRNLSYRRERSIKQLISDLKRCLCCFSESSSRSGLRRDESRPVRYGAISGEREDLDRWLGGTRMEGEGGTDDPPSWKRGCLTQ